MNLLTGVIKDGQVVLSHPAALPDGTEVAVWPYPTTAPLGIADADWPTDPQEIAQLLTRIEQLEPFELTPEEEAGMAAWRQRVKDYTLAHQQMAGEGLFS